MLKAQKNQKIHNLHFERDDHFNDGFVGFTKSKNGEFIEWIVPSRIRSERQAKAWIRNQIEMEQF